MFNIFSDNSDLNLRIMEGGLKANPLTVEGFAMMWAGVRATNGVTSGKVAFEVKVSSTSLIFIARMDLIY